jgi:hypothetical protein
VGQDSSIVRHLRAGQDQRSRIDEAVAAFRRLAPEDYGHFLATIEADLGGGAPTLAGGHRPLLLAGPVEESPPPSGPVCSGTLREAVLTLLADGGARSTMELRRELEAHRPVNRASLNSEIFAMRKLGLVRSEGKGRGTRHAITTAASTRASAGKREPATRPSKRKRTRDDDEDHSARAPKFRRTLSGSTQRRSATTTC